MARHTTQPLFNLKMECEPRVRPLVSLGIGSDKENCVMVRRTAWPLVNLEMECEYTALPLVNPM